jgi:hypothetical protein
MTGEIKNKNNSNSNTSPAPNTTLDFFYSHLEKMSLFGVATDESETIIITRKDSPEATITTSDSTMFTKIRKNILADPEHKNWKVQTFTRTTADKNPLHFVELIITCPKKLVSLRSKTATREMTEEQKEAMRERMSKMRRSRGTDEDEEEY